MTDPTQLPPPRPRLVLRPTCATCAAFHAGPSYTECRMLPPLGQIIFESDKRGGQTMRTAGVHPPVSASHWCLQHEPRQGGEVSRLDRNSPTGGAA